MSVGSSIAGTLGLRRGALVVVTRTPNSFEAGRDPPVTAKELLA